MGNRRAAVTETEVRRMIRACRKEGVEVRRVVASDGKVAVETTGDPAEAAPEALDEQKVIPL